MRSSAEFAQTMRCGTRASRPTVVVHAWRPDVEQTDVSRVGFVVSRSVGGAVVRNRVKRRLRALVRPMAMEPASNGCRIVVRALPYAAIDSKRLPGDVQSAWSSAMAKAGVS